MRHRLRIALGAALLAAANAAAAPAFAGRAGAAVDLGSLLPPPADSGKAPTRLPPPGLEDTAPLGCLPALPCGTRLFGTVRKDGAVELKVPALRW
jgi:hypothetical protein